MDDARSILVLENDVRTQNLIKMLLESLYPGARLMILDQVERAEAHCGAYQQALVIVNWDLPGADSTRLIRSIRKTDSTTPIMMLTGRSDRNSVLKAARLGIQGFIALPFDVKVLKARLEAILPPLESASSASAVELVPMLRSALDQGVRLSSGVSPGELSELMEQADSLSINDLLERWRGHPQLIGVLLNAANSASLRRTGQACSTLKEALSVLGVQISLGHGFVLAMDVRGSLREPRLLARANQLMQSSEQVGLWASRLAFLVRGKAALCLTAGQLCALGEFATLTVCQRFVDAGGALDDEVLEKTLVDWSPLLGNRLKSDWRLPLSLKDLIGAAYGLGRGHQPADRIAMRAAMLLAKDQWGAPELDKLLSRLGIEKEVLLAGVVAE
ncbi:MAG: response regulator [Halomonadaceae bacterium]|nr:MAG: response regulator [Halomonadaceae bacterium]